jgi:hypothetical protein
MADLTPEQLHDVVVVADARTAPEAIFLSEILQDAGIPVMTHAAGAVVEMGLANTAIRVPRVMQQQALDLIATARTKARDNAIDDAFSEETVADTTREADNDPLLAEMFLLREADLEERDAQLRGHVLKWLIEGVRAPDMAKYLAAAGLDYAAASKLVEDVKTENEEEIRKQRQEVSDSGTGLILLSGIGVICAVIIAAVAKSPKMLIVCVPLVIGLAIRHHARKPPETLNKSDDAPPSV